MGGVGRLNRRLFIEQPVQESNGRSPRGFGSSLLLNGGLCSTRS
ncbi:hypothetical protein [Laspinema palackyanum]